MIFPVVFYSEDQDSGTRINNTFQEAIFDSLYTDKDWPGMACAIEQESCIVQPGQFGVDIFPAYVFLRRLPEDPQDAVMVKKIEGRELSAEELINEIADAFNAEFEPDQGSPDPGDGDKPIIVDLPRSPFHFGATLGSLFSFGPGWPDWFSRIKIWHLAVILGLLALMAIILKKIR